VVKERCEAEMTTKESQIPNKKKRKDKNKTAMTFLLRVTVNSTCSTDEEKTEF